MSDAKPTCYCAAHGCPMLGTMSTSTSGGSDWWCYLHFGKDAVRLQALTVEIHRREWLAKIITDIRMTYGTQAWSATYKAAKHELAMQTRNDLQIAELETVWNWMRRLESELEAMCNSTFTKPPKQTRIETEGFQRVQMPMPETVV